jgi:hypothetical protein
VIRRPPPSAECGLQKLLGTIRWVKAGTPPPKNNHPLRRKPDQPLLRREVFCLRPPLLPRKFAVWQ